MEKKQSITWICMFVLIIVVLPIALFLTNKEEEINQENRTLAEFPNFNIRNIDGWITQFDEYVNDHIPRRSDIIRTKNLIDLNMLGISPSKKVVCGEEGWMYLAESVDWYRGKELYTKEELERIEENLLFLANKMSDMGGEFILFIAPNKESIYPEYLPKTIDVSTYNKTDQIVELLIKNGITYVFPKEEIEKYKDKWQLYAKRDTHWNSKGAYIGTSKLNKYIGTEMPILEDLEIYPKPYDGEDLSRQMNLAGYWGNEEDYDYVGYAPGCVISIVDWDATGSTVWYQTTGTSERKVYFIRDSFGELMMNFVAAGSTDVCIRHIDMFFSESIEEEEPDYLVLELVERRLDELLNLGLKE